MCYNNMVYHIFVTNKLETDFKLNNYYTIEIFFVIYTNSLLYCIGALGTIIPVNLNYY